MKKTILYMGNFSFPNGNAAGKRVLGIGYLLRRLGYDIVFLGMDKKLKSDVSIRDTKKIYDGFVYYNISYPKTIKEWFKIRKIYKKTTSFLKSESFFSDVAFTIYYGLLATGFVNLLFYSFFKKRKIFNIEDCADLLISHDGNPLTRFLKNFHYSLKRNWITPKADGFIVISSYLEQYYQKKGGPCVVLPPIVEEQHILGNCKPSVDSRGLALDSPKRLIYAGEPFTLNNTPIRNCSMFKDRLDLAIDYLANATKSGALFQFDIYGLTKEQYLARVFWQQEILTTFLAKNIIFHGRKPNEEIVEALHQADFSILIREINRNTSAGFSTKLVESITCGTPVITTRTSDISQYIQENKNGFFLEFDASQASAKMLKILMKSREEVAQMKNYCKTDKSFNVENFITTADAFFSNFIKKTN